MRGEGVAPKYLAACVVVFVLAMAAFYVFSLSAPETAPETAPATSATPVTAQSAKPWKAPPQKKKKRSRTTGSSSFSGSSRSTSDLSLDSTEDSWSPTAHRIEGRVVGERGRPVPGARVTYRTDGKRRTTKADESGVFSITARGSSVTLQAERKDGLLTVRSKPVIVEGEAGEWEVDLVLETKRQGGLGIGVAKHRDGLRVRSVVGDGPASGLGLRKGDIILEAGGTTLAGFNTREASALLIGPEGSSQTILVRHTDGEEVEYTFRRQHIEKY